ncbi:hypothetical protein E2C01_051018 [Portunus trituberculatus]|uniref:Uncharacterized protein n=1 Tax=Portunus trituberculatus TaxID=210409 RepID=A0A5B7GJ27_PORTR|nr:hypothetical protein [Portunus trituberculatus]
MVHRITWEAQKATSPSSCQFSLCHTFPNSPSTDTFVFLSQIDLDRSMSSMTSACEDPQPSLRPGSNQPKERTPGRGREPGVRVVLTVTSSGLEACSRPPPETKKCRRYHFHSRT